MAKNAAEFVANFMSQQSAPTPAATPTQNNAGATTQVGTPVTKSSRPVFDEVVEAGQSTRQSEDNLFGTEENESSEEGREDTPTDLAATDETTSTGKPSISGSKEVITITDDKGRRKVEIDFENKEQLKKYVQMAYGARKWQAERDKAIEARKAEATKLADVQKNWSVLENAFQQGPEALFDILQGPGSYKQMIEKEVRKKEFLARATPEELEMYNAKEQAQAHARELERIRKENEDFRKKITEDREATEMKSLESQVHPVFDKYRFADKLGDADGELMFDEMLWNTSLKRLEAYEEKGYELSPELVEREFRAVAMNIRKRIGAQAEKKTAKIVEQKKQEATENVQNAVKSQYKGGDMGKEATNLMRSDLRGLVSNWGKYSKLFKK